MLLGIQLPLGLISTWWRSARGDQALGWVSRSRPAARSLKRGGHPRSGRLRPAIVHLEGRWLLSTFTVGLADDAINPTTQAPVPGTLRWAVEQADSAPGSTIVFNPAAFAEPTTIALSSGLGQLDLSARVTIEGPAGTVTIKARGHSRGFQLV